MSDRTKGESLGFIETKGFTGAIEASDAMVKAARVRLIKMHKVGSGRVCVMVEGDVAACQAAVDAGTTAAQRIGEFLLSNVIPRPDGFTEAFVGDYIDDMKDRKAARKANSKAGGKATPKADASTDAVASGEEKPADAKEATPKTPASKPAAKKAPAKKPAAKKKPKK